MSYFFLLFYLREDKDKDKDKDTNKDKDKDTNKDEDKDKDKDKEGIGARGTVKGGRCKAGSFPLSMVLLLWLPACWTEGNTTLLLSSSSNICLLPPMSRSVDLLMF